MNLIQTDSSEKRSTMLFRKISKKNNILKILMLILVTYAYVFYVSFEHANLLNFTPRMRKEFYIESLSVF